MIHILLPAFNEEAALALLLEEILKSLPQGSFRVWVVDDGSTDKTSEVAELWAKKIPLTLIRHGRNKGLGRTLATGFKEMTPSMGPGDVFVTLDADNTHPAALIPELVRPIEAGEADFSIASRFAPGGESVGVPFLRRVTSWGARALYTMVFRLGGVRDYTCGFRAVRGTFLKDAMERWGELVTENGFASSLEWLMKAAALNPRIVEVPLVLRYDQKPSASKMKVLSTVMRSLAVVWRLKGLAKGRGAPA